MDQNYSSKLYSKRKANDYLSRFCVRISSRSLAKQSAGHPVTMAAVSSGYQGCSLV